MTGGAVERAIPATLGLLSGGAAVYFGVRRGVDQVLVTAAAGTIVGLLAVLLSGRWRGLAFVVALLLGGAAVRIAVGAAPVATWGLATLGGGCLAFAFRPDAGEPPGAA